MARGGKGTGLKLRPPSSLLPRSSNILFRVGGRRIAIKNNKVPLITAHTHTQTHAHAHTHTHRTRRKGPGREEGCRKREEEGGFSSKAALLLKNERSTM